MSASLALQQYWQLSRTLMFPLRVTRWLIAGLLVLIALGGMLWWVAEEPMLLMIGGGIAGVITVLICLMLPAQMLSLVSSKQFSWMPGLRNKVFLILLCFYGVIAISGTALMSLAPGDFSLLTRFTVALTFLGFVAVLMLTANAYFQGWQPVVVMLSWGAYFLAGQLLYVNAFIVLALCSLVWFFLYLWWVRWMPQKYFMNYMTVSPEKLRDAQEQHTFSYWMSAEPRSLCGSLLAGASDGIGAILKKELAQLLLVILMVLIFVFLLGGSPKDGFLKMSPLFLFCFIVTRSLQVQWFFYRNLQRAWMLYSGSRGALFQYVERQYLLHIGFAYASLVLLVLFVNFSFFDFSMPLDLVAFLAANSALFAMQLFYLGWVIYDKTAANMIWLGWLTGIAVLLFVVLITLLNLFWMSDASYDYDVYWLLSVMMLIAMVVIRYWAQRVWRKINFYRVKN